MCNISTNLSSKRSDAKTLIDIEIEELDGNALEPREMEALSCFRRLRLSKLQNATNENFNSQYERFRKISVLMDYRDFLQSNCKSFV